jgi:Kae1-associated kinase Bud32
MQLLRKGAEACLYRDTYLGLEVIRKERISKPYRHPVLDIEIRAARTLLDGRLLNEARKNGVPTPAIFQIDPEATTLVMEYLEGALLRDSLASMSRVERTVAFERLGRLLGSLHNGQMVHGDLTTSNVIMDKDGQLRIIDFGLGDYSSEIEARGVDLHLLLRTLESSHSDVAGSCWRSFLKGYKSEFAGESEVILSKVREIRRRGRYVEERRQK